MIPNGPGATPYVTSGPAQGQATPPEVADLGEFTADWIAWHARHEARLADPHGFLTVTSLHWLTETPQRFDDAPSAWHTGPDGDRGRGEDPSRAPLTRIVHYV